MIMLLAVKFDVFCGQFSIDSFKSGTFALFMLAVICPVHASFESKTSKDASYTLKMELLAVVVDAAFRLFCHILINTRK